MIWVHWLKATTKRALKSATWIIKGFLRILARFFSNIASIPIAIKTIIGGVTVILQSQYHSKSQLASKATMTNVVVNLQKYNLKHDPVPNKS